MSPKSRKIPDGGNAPKRAVVTTTATIQVKITMEARSQNELMRIMGAGAHARLIPAGGGLFRVEAEHPGAKTLEVSPI